MWKFGLSQVLSLAWTFLPIEQPEITSQLWPCAKASLDWLEATPKLAPSAQMVAAFVTQNVELDVPLGCANMASLAFFIHCTCVVNHLYSVHGDHCVFLFC